jgi:hypothetical protein
MISRTFQEIQVPFPTREADEAGSGINGGVALMKLGAEEKECPLSVV